MAKINAAIWDCNGTIDNSEHIRRDSIEASLADFGRLFRDSDYPEIMKRVGFVVPAEYICEQYKIDDSEAFKVHWEARFWEMYDRDLALLPGVAHTLEQMKEAGLQLAVASSAYRAYIEPNLAKLGLADAFGVVVTRDDIKVGKPHPEVFQIAAERLGVPANECIALGDTLGDVIGGLSAGMKVIFVPGWYEGSRFHSESIVTLPSLENFGWNVIRQLEGQPVTFRERSL